MDAIIDDSLKATRTAYRVLIAAAGATMVFSLSLQAPAAKVALREGLESMLTFSFRSYDKVVDAKISELETAHLKSVQEEAARRLAAKQGLVFGVERIAEAMGKAMVLNRFVLSDTKLNAPGAATLDELDALDGAFELGEDAQALLPDVAQVVEQVGVYLDANRATGQAVDAVSLTVDSSTVDTVRSTAAYQLYFELRSTGAQQAAPVFMGEFRAPMKAIAGTAFTDWIASSEQAREFVVAVGTTLRWLPAFRDNPESIRRGDQSMPFKELLDRTAADIDNHGPGKQVVSFLGTSVPGQLVAFAAPFVLLLLSYSLHNHIAHLCKLKREVYADLGRFAWMPVSLPLFQGLLEFWCGAVILPFLSLVALQVKLWGEDDLRAIRLVCIAIGMVGVLEVGWRAARKLTILRDPSEAATASKGARRF